MTSATQQLSNSPPKIGGARAWVLVGATALLIAAAAFAVDRWNAKPSRSKSGVSSASSNEPSKKQQRAAEYNYPTPSAALPKSIAVSYDPGKDRTTMTLMLAGMPVSVPSAYRTTGPSFQIISEFAGQSRKPDAGELSVRCLFSATTTTPGVLAPSSPIATFTADGTSFESRPPPSNKAPFRSESSPAGTREIVEFRLSTSGLIALAHAKSVSAQIGTATLTFSPSQISDLREFAARMNPRGTPK